MRGRDLTDLLVLAAVWGASFLFIRMAVGEFGPFALIELRVGLGALSLLPFVLLAGKSRQIIKHWKVLAVSGTLNAALPFTFYAYAAQALGAGYLSVINAVTPAWVAVIGWVWFRDRLPRLSIVGLLVGFSGIVVLVWDKLFVNVVSTRVDTDAAQLLGTLAALCAPICYGLAANHAKRYLSGVDPIVNAAGSMTGAAMVLLPFAIYTWPPAPISFQAWAATVLLAVVCTGLAYIMFFRLLASVGPTKAVT
ncbi:MAG: EamA family transporter, partial [Comamonadaceae bacterium]